MTSPNHVLSRLIHGDNLKNWPIEEVMLIEQRIYDHIERCKHPKCETTKCMYDNYDQSPVEAAINAIY